jgi:hypothetical protein
MLFPTRSISRGPPYKSLHVTEDQLCIKTLKNSEDVSKSSRVFEKMSPMVYFPGQISLFLKLLALRMRGPPFYDQNLSGSASS